MTANLLSITRLLIPCLLLLSACSGSGIQDVTQEDTGGGSLVWPEKPADPRIAYIRNFSTADDLGIKKGFFSRLFEFIAGASERRLVRPMAILVTAQGDILVADPGARGVHRFSTANDDYDLIMGPDEQPLPSPMGLAAGSHGEVYITDSALGRLFILQPGEDSAQPFKVDVRPEQPTGIAVDPQRQALFVVDAKHHHINQYTFDGRLLRSIGQRGEHDGEFNYPGMIWLDDKGRLLVSDALNFRIQMFDLEGGFLGQFGHHGNGTGDMSRPKGVATDSYGHVYVVDALFHSVQLFNDKGEYLMNFGRQGNATAEFLLPTGIFISRDNIIYVADSHNRRIQVFRYIGNQS